MCDMVDVDFFRIILVNGSCFTFQIVSLLHVGNVIDVDILLALVNGS